METDWVRHNECMTAENAVTVRINQDKSKYRITAILKVQAKILYKMLENKQFCYTKYQSNKMKAITSNK